MPNIHAINAQGTEYGITAENGITQAQVAKIGTIGNVADLATDDKATLVAAINEIITPTLKSGATFTYDGDATASYVFLREPTVIGKIAFMPIEISNVAGANIGGYVTQSFITSSLRLSGTVSVYGQDYTTGNMARFVFLPNGTIEIGESQNIRSGINEFRFTAILPLA